MNPEKYAIGDFLLDKSFCDWVRQESPRENLYWDIWLHQHPEKTRLVEEASAIINGIPFISKERPHEELIASRQLLLENIRLSRKTSGLTQPIAGPGLPGRGFLCRWRGFFKGFWRYTRISRDKDR